MVAANNFSAFVLIYAGFFKESLFSVASVYLNFSSSFKRER